MLNNYIAVLNFLSKKFNVKTSQDWHLIFFSFRDGQILMLNNFGSYIGYFEYPSVVV